MVEWIINVMIYGIIFTLIGLVFAIFIFYMTYDPLHALSGRELSRT